MQGECPPSDRGLWVVVSPPSVERPPSDRGPACRQQCPLSVARRSSLVVIVSGGVMTSVLVLLWLFIVAL